LGFVHPDTSENMRFAGVVPDDMASLVEALRVPAT
jgi:hypothetical protein